MCERLCPLSGRLEGLLLDQSMDRNIRNTQARAGVILEEMEYCSGKELCQCLIGK